MKSARRPARAVPKTRSPSVEPWMTPGPKKSDAASLAASGSVASAARQSIPSACPGGRCPDTARTARPRPARHAARARPTCPVPNTTCGRSSPIGDSGAAKASAGPMPAKPPGMVYVAAPQDDRYGDADRDPQTRRCCHILPRLGCALGTAEVQSSRNLDVVYTQINERYFLFARYARSAAETRSKEIRRRRRARARDVRRARQEHPPHESLSIWPVRLHRSRPPRAAAPLPGPDAAPRCTSWRRQPTS